EKGVAKRAGYLLVCSRDSRRIGNAPMRGHGLARPDGTSLTGGIVTNGEDKIHARRGGVRGFFPAFAAQVRYRYVSGLQLPQCLRPHSSGWMAASTVGCEPRLSFVIQDGFGHDRTCGISGTEEQNVVVCLHWLVFLLCRPISCNKTAR